VTVYELKGPEDLARLSRVLKAVGDKDLQRELSKAIQAAMLPVREELPRSAQRLPRRGGLAARVAASKTRIQRRNTGRAVGVRLRVDNEDNIRRIDKGTVRHPVFGRWRAGVKPQPVKPGWFTDPTDAARPAFAAAVDRAQNDIAAKIDRK
jgi:hypothetical protein